jgi:Ras-related protein Rab-11A
VGAIIVFDLTKFKSFENIQKWLAELKDNAEPRITVMLVGNKADLTELREVKHESIEDYVNQNHLFYL